jgi:hypothetical protein
MIQEIRTINDVKLFAKHLTQIEGLSFHPDDDFRDYRTIENKPFYSEDEAAFRNELMNECFKVCDKEKVEIYKLLLPIIKEPILGL